MPLHVLAVTGYAQSSGRDGAGAPDHVAWNRHAGTRRPDTRRVRRGAWHVWGRARMVCGTHRREHATLHCERRHRAIEHKLLDLVKEYHDALELEQPLKHGANARGDVAHAILEKGTAQAWESSMQNQPRGPRQQQQCVGGMHTQASGP